MKTTRDHFRDARWPVLLALAVAATLAIFAVAPPVANALGLGLQNGWFLDTHALLAAGEAHVRGLNVYAHNPLDIYGRPHSYPSVWLWLGDAGLTRADTRWLGATIVTAFVLVAGWAVRPRSGREFGWATALLCSPAVMLALVRANNDLVVFLVLAALVSGLRSERSIARVGAAAWIAVAAGLKYFPAAAALLLLHERERRLFWWRAALLLALLVLVAASVREDMRHFAATLPAPTGFFSFGAAQALRQLGVAAALRWLVLLAVVAIGARGANRGAIRSTSSADELRFVLGAILLAACFWLTMNWAYRWIFAVWLLPLLLRGDESALLSRRARRALLWLIALSVWWDGLGSLLWNLGGARDLGVDLNRYSDTAWLIAQPANWAVAIMLTLACVRFARGEISALWRRPSPPPPIRYTASAAPLEAPPR